MKAPRGNIYVNSQGLLNLKNDYKYTGGDKSLVAARMQHFWNWLVQYIPRSVAPNMVTLVGLFFIFLSYGLNVYYTPEVKGIAPWYIYVIHAICLFFYQTLDALDGKHARRTKNSSALGELFDHGCDAVSTTMIVLTSAASIQTGPTILLFYVVIISNLVFFFAQWDQYTAGSLVLGYINVTEAQFSGMAIHLISAFVGPDFWLTTFKVGEYTLRYQHLIIIAQSLALIVTMILNIVNVLEIVTKKKLGKVKTMGQLIPVTLTTIMAIVWVIYSPNVIKNQPQAFLMSLGMLFPNLVGRIVFARMCKADFSAFQLVILPFALGPINAIAHQIVPEQYIVWGLLAFYTFAYSHFAWSVIDVLCALLDIQCLTPKIVDID